MAMTMLVMRHAEKSGDPDDPHLTPAGYQRARTLTTFIPEKFGIPGFIFAASNSPHSSRPYETIAPLAQAAGVTIDSSYADQDYGALAQDLRGKVRFRDSTVIVCWHHGNIPNLMYSLRALDGDYPDPWPREVFNMILHTTISAEGAVSVSPITEPF